jgi:hypothetical protein
LWLGLLTMTEGVFSNLMAHHLAGPSAKWVPARSCARWFEIRAAKQLKFNMQSAACPKVRPARLHFSALS